MKRTNTKQLARGRKCYAKARTAGWIPQMVWFRQNVADDIARRAASLNTSKGTVLRAAVEVGMRRLTSGDVQAAERRWHETMGWPMPILVKRGQARAVRNPLTRKFEGFAPIQKTA